MKLIIELNPEKSNISIDEFINQMIAKMTENLEKFRYNVLIANLHEIYNFLSQIIKQNKNFENLKDNYFKILICISPILPHLSSECISSINQNIEKLVWPEPDNKFLKQKEFQIVVQINGKKRGILVSQNSPNEEELIEKINNDESLKKYIDKKEITKRIYVKNKLVNLLVK